MKVAKEIEHLFTLWMLGQAGEAMPTLPLQEWEDEGPVDWDSVMRDIEQREISRYNAHLGILRCYEADTMKQVRMGSTLADKDTCRDKDARHC